MGGDVLRKYLGKLEVESAFREGNGKSFGEFSGWLVGVRGLLGPIRLQAVIAGPISNMGAQPLLGVLG